MNEKPILFSTPMVKAIFDGRKTQTRRVINPQPDNPHVKIFGPEMYSPGAINRDGELNPGPEIYGVYDEDGEWGVKCPYGRPGDRLWVKETFVKFNPSHRPPQYGYKADMPVDRGAWLESEQARRNLGYTWTPSIFMPRVASRLLLDVLSIRVQRVQEISERDAIAEGVDESKIPLSATPHNYDRLAINLFMLLWDSINAKPRPRYETVDGHKVISYYESFPWEDVRETREYRGKPWYVYGNPLVWAVKFSRTKSLSSEG